jgi:hypothetical protein
MPRIKKKVTSVTSIAKEVAKVHGITVTSAKPIVQSAIEVMTKQLFETGYLRLPGFANINIGVGMSKKGKISVRCAFRPCTAFKIKRDAILTDPTRLEFVNYLLERDELLLHRSEQRRVARRVYRAEQHPTVRLLRQQAHAASIKELTGVDVPPESIPVEHVIRGTDYIPPLPDSYTEIRDLIAKNGVFPLEKLHRCSHLTTGTPVPTPPSDSVDA